MNLLNCQRDVSLYYVKDNPKIYVAEQPKIANGGKMIIDFGYSITNVVGQLIAPMDDYQLNLDDFDFDVWTDNKPYKIYLDDDGIIKIKVGE